MALPGTHAATLVPGARRHLATEKHTLQRNMPTTLPSHRLGSPLLSRTLDTHTASLACAGTPAADPLRRQQQRCSLPAARALRVAPGAGRKGSRGGRASQGRGSGAPAVHRPAAASAAAVPTLAPEQEAVTYKEQATEDLLLSCTTFNVLAPIYKRLGGREDVRESMFPDQWRPRNEAIVKELLARRSSIVCLQELWLSNPELVELYEGALHAEGYTTLKLPRPNNRGDGLLTAVKEDTLEVVNHEDVLFNDCGDRVAQIVWIRSKPGTCRVPGAEEGGRGEGGGEEPRVGPCMEMLVVNTHLLFPHNASSSVIRLRQVYKVLEHVEAYKARHNLGPVPVVLCGDLNGTKRGQVYNFLRSQGFVSSYDMAHNYPDSDQRWVTHRNHHGKVCGVDYVWLLNPTKETSPLALDWKAAVFNHLKTKLEMVGCDSDQEAFQFFCNPEEDLPSPPETAATSAAPATSAAVASVAAASAAGAAGAPGAPGEAAITMRSMARAIARIGSEMALSKGELEEILAFAGADGDGRVGPDTFRAALQRRRCAPLFSSSLPPSLSAAAASSAQTPPTPTGTSTAREELGDAAAEQGVEEGAVSGLMVAEASLYPPETQAGVWPQDYTLSDHAVLTAVFTTIGMVMSRVEGC